MRARRMWGVAVTACRRADFCSPVAYPAVNTTTTPPAMTVRPMKTMMLLRKKFATAISYQGNPTRPTKALCLPLQNDERSARRRCEEAVREPGHDLASAWEAFRAREGGREGCSRKDKSNPTRDAPELWGLFAYDLHLQCRRLLSDARGMALPSTLPPSGRGAPMSGEPNLGFSLLMAHLPPPANVPTSAACCVKFLSSSRWHQRWR